MRAVGFLRAPLSYHHGPRRLEDVVNWEMVVRKYLMAYSVDEEDKIRWNLETLLEDNLSSHGEANGVKHNSFVPWGEQEEEEEFNGYVFWLYPLETEIVQFGNKPGSVFSTIL